MNSALPQKIINASQSSPFYTEWSRRKKVKVFYGGIKEMKINKNIKLSFYLITVACITLYYLTLWGLQYGAIVLDVYS